VLSERLGFLSSSPVRARVAWRGLAAGPAEHRIGEVAPTHIAEAIERVRALLGRRPRAAIHADEAATACLQEDLRVLVRHGSGVQIKTDMPGELGGGGIQPTPGWLLRAGLASCAATCIAMEAATAGITLQRLEITARSTSDSRGILCVPGERGETISAAPTSVELEIRAAAAGTSAKQLTELIANGCRCSPVSCALQSAIPVALRIEVEAL